MPYKFKDFANTIQLHNYKPELEDKRSIFYIRSFIIDAHHYANNLNLTIYQFDEIEKTGLSEFYPHIQP